MQWVWKLLLVFSIGGYLLYTRRKGNDDHLQSSGDGEQAIIEEDVGAGAVSEDKVASEPGEQTIAREENKPEGISKETEKEVIHQLSQIEGVTSRVAKNLFDRGIYTAEDLKKLSGEELLSVKGIGPKRKEKILNAGTTDKVN